MQMVKVESHPGCVPDDRFSEGLDKLKQDAVEGFEKKGEIPPLIVVLTDKSTDIILWADGSIPYDFLEYVYHGKARAYYAVFESWYVEAKTEDVEHIGSPSQHPDRKEALMVIGESRDGWCEMMTWDIIRNGAGVHLVRNKMDSRQTESRLAEVLWKAGQSEGEK